VSDDWSQFPTAPPAEHDWSAFPTGTQTLASEFGYVDNPARGGTGDPGTSGNWYTGAWGDDIANQRDLGVSLPRSVLRQHFGDENLAHNAPVAVTNPATGKTAVGYIRDKGPGESQQAGLDLMYAMAREIGAGNNALTPVSYRILAQKGSGALPEATGPQDWSAFPTTPQQTPQPQHADRNLADDGTETGRNARVVAASSTPQQDWSAFPTAPPAPPNVPGRNIQQSEIQGGNKVAAPAQPKPTPEATQWEPESQPSKPTPEQIARNDSYFIGSDGNQHYKDSAGNVSANYQKGNLGQVWPFGSDIEIHTSQNQKAPPGLAPVFDTVHKTVQNYWENAKQSAAQLNLAAQQGSAYNPTLPTDPIEQEIKRTQESTLLSDDQKAQTIAALRKGQTTVQANRMGAIVTEKANIAQAEAAKPDKAFQESFLGRASGMAGQATPYLASGAAGPMAPILAATQMAAGAYGSAIDRSVQDAKRLHPDWSDAQLLVAANAAANESAKNAGAAGLALSLIPIPAAGPLIARMVEKWGLSAAMMVLAQQYARVQENVALKKNINPGQDLLEGLRENLGQDIAQGLAFGFPHAFGEFGRGGQRGQPQAETQAKAEVTPPELPDQSGAPSSEVPSRSQQVPALSSGNIPQGQDPIAAAAVRDQHTGVIYSGTNHGDAWEKAGRIINVDSGFVTESGKFVPDYESGLKSSSQIPQVQGQTTAVTAQPKSIDPTTTAALRANQPQPAPEIEQPPPMSSVRGAQARSQYAEQPQGQPAGGFEQEAFDWRKESPKSRQLHEQWMKNNPWEPQVVPEDDQWISAIANRFTEERSAAGEIGEIAPGVGYSRTDLREIGLRMRPEQIVQHVSDLMHNTGDPKLQAAAITAEEARLSQVSSRLSRLAEDQPGNRQIQADAENAFQDLTDFHNGPVAKLKNNWHAQGMTLQGEIPVDLGAFNGQREAWLRDVGKPITPEIEATMRRSARKVRDAVTAENAALDQLAQKVESLKRAKIPSADEVRNNIMERLKDIPCVTR
jgi:hypothetical protein